MSSLRKGNVRAALFCLALCAGLGFSSRGHAQGREPTVDPIKLDQEETERVTAAISLRKPLLEQADADLRNGRSRKAILGFARALVVPVHLSPRSLAQYRNNEDRNRAARGLARANADLGQFDIAAGWLRKTEEFPTDWCGVAVAGYQFRVAGLLKVWELAATHAQDEKNLRALLSRLINTPSAKGEEDAYEVYLRTVAANEARLLLAQLLIRQGTTGKARQLLKPMARTPNSWDALDSAGVADALLQRCGR